MYLFCHNSCMCAWELILIYDRKLFPIWNALWIASHYIDKILQTLTILHNMLITRHIVTGKPPLVSPTHSTSYIQQCFLTLYIHIYIFYIWFRIHSIYLFPSAFFHSSEKSIFIYLTVILLYTIVQTTNPTTTFTLFFMIFARFRVHFFNVFLHYY